MHFKRITKSQVILKDFKGYEDISKIWKDFKRFWRDITNLWGFQQISRGPEWFQYVQLKIVIFCPRNWNFCLSSVVNQYSLFVHWLLQRLKFNLIVKSQRSYRGTFKLTQVVWFSPVTYPFQVFTHGAKFTNDKGAIQENDTGSQTNRDKLTHGHALRTTYGWPQGTMELQYIYIYIYISVCIHL